jgi:hypothetical protein
VQATAVSNFPKKLRQLGDIRCDPARLVARQHFGHLDLSLLGWRRKRKAQAVA